MMMLVIPLLNREAVAAATVRHQNDQIPRPRCRRIAAAAATEQRRALKGNLELHPHNATELQSSVEIVSRLSFR
jgi:hypothetical protein